MKPLDVAIHASEVRPMVDEWENQTNPSLFSVGDEAIQALKPIFADIHFGAMGCGIPGLEIDAAPGFAIEERGNSQNIEADAFRPSR